jgi:two-component system response regulator DesR
MLSLSQFEARSARRSTRVALADGQALLSQALGLVIEQQPGLTLVGTARTCAAALQLALRAQPDVLLLAAELPDGDGVALAATLRDLCPNTRILILASQADDGARQHALAVGAAGILSKDLSVDEVLAGIRLAATQHRVGPMLPSRQRAQPQNLSLGLAAVVKGERPLSAAGRERRAAPTDGTRPHGM